MLSLTLKMTNWQHFDLNTIIGNRDFEFDLNTIFLFLIVIVLLIIVFVMIMIKMMMSLVLMSGLNCKFISRLIEKEKPHLMEMFGFEIISNWELIEVMSFCKFYNIDVDIKTTVGENCHKIMMYRYMTRFNWFTFFPFIFILLYINKYNVYTDV